MKEKEDKNQEKKDKRTNLVKSESKSLVKQMENNFEDLQNKGSVVFVSNMAFYSIYRKLIKLTVINTITLLIALIGISYYVSYQAAPQYISIDQNNQVIQEPPLSDPAFADSVITTAAFSVMKDLNSYDFKNWESTLPKAEKYFSKKGWMSFLRVFKASGDLTFVRTTNSIVSADITGEIKITGKKVVDGVFTWKVVVPSIIYYEPTKAGEQAVKKSGKAIMYIQRTLLKDNPQGFSVEVYQFESDK